MPKELFNSPEKKWVRTRLWLPALQELKTQMAEEIRYLTLAGPQGHDLELFAIRKKLISIDNSHVWEGDQNAVRSLAAKYGPTLRIKPGEAFDLCRAKAERQFFPYHLINLDYTSGAFNVDSPRALPKKFETIYTIVTHQKESATSFLLFLAVAAGPDVDTERGRLFVQKAAFDLAKRLGKTEPLFDLTRDIKGLYPNSLATIIPCIVIRMGGEQYFDTQCAAKAVYRPFRSRKTLILSFVFNFAYGQPPLTLSFHQNITTMDGIIEKRQLEACGLTLVNVNSKVRANHRRQN